MKSLRKTYQTHHQQQLLYRIIESETTDCRDDDDEVHSPPKIISSSPPFSFVNLSEEIDTAAKASSASATPAIKTPKRKVLTPIEPRSSLSSTESTNSGSDEFLSDYW